MQDAPATSETPSPESVATTRKHMADAVSYLIMIATDAGLGNVASKLVRIRTSLLRQTPSAINMAGDEKQRH